eukprot:5532842-Pyramimonas_sp.AAC.1
MLSTMMKELTISIREWGFEWKPSSVELATFWIDFDADPLEVQIPTKSFEPVTKRERTAIKSFESAARVTSLTGPTPLPH